MGNKKSNFLPTNDYSDYASVPVYRKRWFVVMTFLFFSPLCIAIALSGKIYACVDGEVREYPKNFGITISIACVAFMVMAVLRIIG